MAWARICSVRGSLARRSPLSLISATRITQALGGCDQSATNTGVDDGHQCGVPWKRCASGVGGGSDNSSNNGGSGDSEGKGQWRQWIEQRLKAKEAGEAGTRKEASFSSRSSEFHDRSRPGAFTGSSTDTHPAVEPMDDFESKVLGLSSKKDGVGDDDLLRELDEIERAASWGAARTSDEEVEEGELEGEPETEEDSELEDDDDDDDDDDDEEYWEDESGQVLSDFALSAIVDYDLDDEERPYQFRPDRLFFPGQTYDPEDLDLSKKPDQLERPPPRFRRRYEVKEVLQKADFRNPRYLSNFIAETSRILPKRRSKLSAKAQRKVIREIKTARTFGLMPFTSMGQAPFRFLRSRIDEDGSTKNY